MVDDSASGFVSTLGVPRSRIFLYTNLENAGVSLSQLPPFMVGLRGAVAIREE